MIKLSQPIISEESIQAVSDILRSGMLVQGKYVEQFEEALKKYMNANHVLAISSGTAALHVALAALEIGENDAVFVPAFTFPATANVVEIQKARTVLVDVDPFTYNMDPDKLEEAIINYNEKEKPKAIIVVHEFGAPANMTRIMEIANKYRLYVIEDAACALGTKLNGQHVGTFGDIGCFSFHPRKAITTGEGGAVITKNEHLKKKISLLRNHGLIKLNDGTMDFLLPGFNYRMTEFQAVLGTHQLSMFNNWIKKRNELVNIYYQLLKENPTIQLPDNLEGHAWQTFMVVIDSTSNRKAITKCLKSKEIETNMGAQAVHMLSFYNNKYQYKVSEFPIAKKLYESGLALPLHSNLNSDDIKYICENLLLFL
ncbi:DegT/DnrJ/EryC1/StrS aminotransferase family protein [Lysinibacillus sp. BW-2-10]|uniref:DegT/DnrJ/EryC1/StrS family aminotransferase n=1 Tax=Lysinibacillus sp. BW-2-10 TaxID=2590030 RepID=UPI00117F2229|nr:DegT/DnrJ/EryC1/StrS family aminotransferase [Lysinibacillus sp. BW-2-10]TSI04305.1 DegT/DnrJ/EryC1/StrS family aminotransferase [Lysinibacillus sp. BW-2-10]